MNIGVFGAGYVGLVTAVCLSDMGYKLWVVEKDKEKLEKLKIGINTIYEPGLTELLQKNIQLGRIQFTEEGKSVVENCEIIFLCVGTPSRPDGSADMSQIEAAMKEIVEQSVSLGQYRLVVVKSTVPVGTSAWMRKIATMYAKGSQHLVDLASNPEFLREGVAIKDFKEPDRIVLGCTTDRARELLSKVYEPFICPKIVTDSNTAEIIKYAANSFLATKISFINMVADLCESVGGDISQVAEGMGYDNRIGKDFLKAGIGFGGSCFPKDLRAFLHIGESYNLNFGLLKEVIKINQSRPERVVALLKEMLWVLEGKRITILGLTFKPNTDDVRESPAAGLIAALKAEGAKITATDPIGIENFKKMYVAESKDIEFEIDTLKSVENSHALILVTDWNEYSTLDWVTVKEFMELPVILDGRNLLNEDLIRTAGFQYAAIGR
ncbi:UDP-glucose/GDP-mannose dehydrogenase family protein [Bacillus sp. 3255]|uniref:UDP-glucose dehydrogenase family protein n=1 Tax=Bacillus sp. 3255 TaxID=2817904 RepID=UPI00285457A4|nr:UDP-glucose/GDP-mannose dehydrogenase family protein [Bacillus sp. 3255]MDR6878739.1 UDPglucose 6-dehydrogenase [Bacillus sp. 3255]